MPTPTPTRKRATKSCGTDCTNADTIEKTTKNSRLATKIARRPQRSDMSPNTSSPTIAPRKVDAPSAPVCGGREMELRAQQDQRGAHDDQVVAVDELAERHQDGGITLARRQATVVEFRQRSRWCADCFGHSVSPFGFVTVAWAESGWDGNTRGCWRRAATKFRKDWLCCMASDAPRQVRP